MTPDVGFADVMRTLGYAVIVSIGLGLFTGLLFILWLQNLIIADGERAVVKRKKRIVRQSTADVGSIQQRFQRRQEEAISANR